MELSGAPEHSVYASTKGAIIAYTRTLGVELASQRRSCQCDCAWVGCNVENHTKSIPGFDERSKAPQHAKRRCRWRAFGVPLDIAKLAVFLCSNESSYIVGQTIIADGGTTALMSLISDFRNESTAHFGTGYVPGL